MSKTLPVATTDAVGIDADCMCIGTVNSLLREHNSILMTNLFGKPRAIVATVKFDEKKRGKPKLMFASFCPFCGVRYASSVTKSVVNAVAIADDDSRSKAQGG